MSAGGQGIGPITQRLLVDDEMTPKLRAASAELAAMGRKMKTIGADLSTAGSGLTRAVTVPLALAGAAAFKFSTDFGLGMAKIENLVGINRDTLASWKDDILQLGKDTARGPDDLARALFFVTSAGLRGKEALEALEFSAKGAAIGLGSTVVVADAVTSAMNAYSKMHLKAADATNILALAVRAGKLEADQMAPVLGRILPIAAFLGIQFDNVAGTMAALTRTGLKAAEAATSLNSLMSMLAKGGTEDAKKMLGKVGLTMQQVRDVAAGPNGLVEAIRLLDRTLLKLDNESLAKVVPNLRAFRAVANIIAQEGVKVDWVMNTVASGIDLVGDGMERVAQEKGFKFMQFINEMKINFLEMGDALAPAFDTMLKTLDRFAKAVKKLTILFNGIPGPIKTVVASLLALVALAGPVLILTGALINAGGAIFLLTAKIKSLNITLGVSAGPLGVILLAVSALAGAAILWNDRNTQLLNNMVVGTERMDKFGKAINDLRIEMNEAAAAGRELNTVIFDTARLALRGAGKDLSDATAKLNEMEKDTKHLWRSFTVGGEVVEGTSKALDAQRDKVQALTNQLRAANTTVLASIEANNKAKAAASGRAAEEERIADEAAARQAILIQAKAAAEKAAKEFATGLANATRRAEEDARAQEIMNTAIGMGSWAMRDAARQADILSEAIKLGVKVDDERLKSLKKWINAYHDAIEVTDQLTAAERRRQNQLQQRGQFLDQIDTAVENLDAQRVSVLNLVAAYEKAGSGIKKFGKLGFESAKKLNREIKLLAVGGEKKLGQMADEFKRLADSTFDAQFSADAYTNVIVPMWGEVSKLKAETFELVNAQKLNAEEMMVQKTLMLLGIDENHALAKAIREVAKATAEATAEHNKVLFKSNLKASVFEGVTAGLKAAFSGANSRSIIDAFTSALSSGIGNAIQSQTYQNAIASGMSEGMAAGGAAFTAMFSAFVVDNTIDSLTGKKTEEMMARFNAKVEEARQRSEALWDNIKSSFGSLFGQVQDTFAKINEILSETAELGKSLQSAFGAVNRELELLRNELLGVTTSAFTNVVFAAQEFNASLARLEQQIRDTAEAQLETRKAAGEFDRSNFGTDEDAEAALNEAIENMELQIAEAIEALPEALDLQDVANRAALQFAGIKFNMESLNKTADLLIASVKELNLGFEEEKAIIDTIEFGRLAAAAEEASRILTPLFSLWERSGIMQTELAQERAKLEQVQAQITLQRVKIEAQLAGLWTETLEKALNALSNWVGDISNFVIQSVNIGTPKIKNISGGGKTGGSKGTPIKDLKKEFDDWLFSHNGAKGYVKTVKELVREFDDALKKFKKIPGAMKKINAIFKREFRELMKEWAGVPETLGDGLRQLRDEFMEFSRVARELGLSQSEVNRRYRQAMQNFLKNILSGVQEFRDNMLTSANSPVAPASQFAIIRERFDDVLRRARSGDIEAINQLPSAAQELLDRAAEVFGTSSGAFRSIFESIQRSLDLVLNGVPNVLSYDATRQIEAIVEVKDNITTHSDRMAGYWEQADNAEMERQRARFEDRDTDSERHETDDSKRQTQIERLEDMVARQSEFIDDFNRYRQERLDADSAEAARGT